MLPISRAVMIREDKYIQFTGREGGIESYIVCATRAKGGGQGGTWICDCLQQSWGKRLLGLC